MGDEIYFILLIKQQEHSKVNIIRKYEVRYLREHVGMYVSNAFSASGDKSQKSRLHIRSLIVRICLPSFTNVFSNRISIWLRKQHELQDQLTHKCQTKINLRLYFYKILNWNLILASLHFDVRKISSMDDTFKFISSWDLNKELTRN